MLESMPDGNAALADSLTADGKSKGSDTTAAEGGDSEESDRLAQTLKWRGEQSKPVQALSNGDAERGSLELTKWSSAV
jgi:hypothetical protein